MSGKELSGRFLKKEIKKGSKTLIRLFIDFTKLCQKEGLGYEAFWVAMMSLSEMIIRQTLDQCCNLIRLATKGNKEYEHTLKMIVIRMLQEAIGKSDLQASAKILEDDADYSEPKH